MSEEPGVYMELKFSLKALDSRLQAINTDPTASYWLKRAVTELWERDVVDALDDLDVLRDLLEEKHRIHAGMLKRMVTSDDGTRH